MASVETLDLSQYTDQRQADPKWVVAPDGNESPEWVVAPGGEVEHVGAPSETDAFIKDLIAADIREKEEAAKPERAETAASPPTILAQNETLSPEEQLKVIAGNKTESKGTREFEDIAIALKQTFDTLPPETQSKYEAELGIAWRDRNTGNGASNLEKILIAMQSEAPQAASRIEDQEKEEVEHPDTNETGTPIEAVPENEAPQDEKPAEPVQTALEQPAAAPATETIPVAPEPQVEKIVPEKVYPKQTHFLQGFINGLGINMGRNRASYGVIPDLPPLPNLSKAGSQDEANRMIAQTVLDIAYKIATTQRLNLNASDADHSRNMAAQISHANAELARYIQEPGRLAALKLPGNFRTPQEKINRVMDVLRAAQIRTKALQRYYGGT